MINRVILGVFGLGSAELIILLIIIPLALIPFVFYLITLQNILKKVSPENQKMPPANVWLLFIPLFNIGWHFVVVSRVSDSLKAEFTKRGITFEAERPAYGVGLAYCILNCCTIIPVLGIVASIGWLICWIIFWVKVSSYGTKLN